MGGSQRKAVSNHRRRQRAKGLVRIEVQALAADVTLIKRLARMLRGNPDQAERLRASLSKTVGTPQRSSFRALLASAPWDDAFERELIRDKTPARRAPI